MSHQNSHAPVHGHQNETPTSRFAVEHGGHKRWSTTATSQCGPKHQRTYRTDKGTTHHRSNNGRKSDPTIASNHGDAANNRVVRHCFGSSLKKSNMMARTFWTFLLLCSLSWIPPVNSGLNSAKKKNNSQPTPNPYKPVGEANYLYSTEDAKPVIEYRGPTAPGEQANHPNFIYDPSNGPRIVEFYAPWCPHCRHFRNHYVSFAQQITNLAKENDAHVDVYSVSCTAHRPICQQFGVYGYPKIFLFKAGDVNSTTQANYWTLHPFQVLNDLGVTVSNLKLNLEAEPVSPHGAAALIKPGSAADFRNELKSLQARTKQQVYDDAHLSFHFNLRTGIFMTNGKLENKTQTALKHWLDLLKVALPPTWSVQTLIKELLTKFDKIILSEDNLLKIVDAHPPPASEWSPSCTHGDPTAGYTCGLWEFFHIMTVGVVEWNLMINTDDNDALVLSTDMAANTLRDFIENFFGCEVCRTNFIAAFDSCAHDRCNRLTSKAGTLGEWIQLPVWLWETHNSVNVRLLHEKAEREGWTATHEDELEKTWPTRRDCPKCWYADEEGGFSDTTIYKLLRMEYW